MRTTAYEPIRPGSIPLLPENCPICEAGRAEDGVLRDLRDQWKPWCRYECGGAYVLRPNADAEETVWIGACGEPPGETNDVYNAAISYLEWKDAHEEHEFEAARSVLYAAVDEAIEEDKARLRAALELEDEVRHIPL